MQEETAVLTPYSTVLHNVLLLLFRTYAQERIDQFRERLDGFSTSQITVVEVLNSLLIAYAIRRLD